MNKQLKAKWTEALRSGRYQQTRGLLCRNGAYCCLGVLREVAGFGWMQADEDGDREAVDALGIRDFGGLTQLELAETKLRIDQMQKLATMNDGEGKTFAQIADYIDAHL